MEKISDIQDYIDDAFDIWPELNCQLEGLLGYVGEYNDCFIKGIDNPDRAAHVILFVKKAVQGGHKIPDKIKEECLCEIEYMKKNYGNVLKDEIKYLESQL